MNVKALATLVFSGILALTCSFKHVGPKEDVLPRTNLDKVGEKIAKQYGLKLLLSGLGKTVIAVGNATWALGFTSQKAMTIEEARPIAQDIANRLLNTMYKDPSFRAYDEHEGQYYGKVEALTDARIGFKLAFWDKDVNRPLYPYLAQVSFAEGKLYYYYADPQTQALQPPVEEPLKK